MRIDPKTLPDGTVIETVHGTLRYLNGVYNPSEWGHEVTRVFVPAPEGMTYADAEAALADAGAWVETPEQDIPFNARVREEYRGWQADPGPGRFYVHRDDLPPTDPDAELVEAIEKSVPIGSWDGREVLRRLRAEGFDVTHEAKS